MFLGAYQLGDLLPVSVWTRDSALLPAEPDGAPVVHIINSSGATVYSKLLPIIDRKDITGFFNYRVNLNEAFAAGFYTVHINYQISSTAYAETRQFEIKAGGNAQGNGIAMYFFKAPASDYVLMQTDQGTLKRLKNPSVRSV